MFALLHSRLLRPVFIALGMAMLVQVFLAVWLTRTTVDDLVADLATRLEGDSQSLGAALSGRLQAEQEQLRGVLEQNLKQSGSAMAQLLAGVAPKAIWDDDVP